MEWISLSLSLRCDSELNERNAEQERFWSISTRKKEMQKTKLWISSTWIYTYVLNALTDQRVRVSERGVRGEKRGYQHNDYASSPYSLPFSFSLPPFALASRLPSNFDWADVCSSHAVCVLAITIRSSTKLINMFWLWSTTNLSKSSQIHFIKDKNR